MSPTSPVLRLTNIRTQRAGTVIIEDISWTIERGEHWVVLGANGSGKTSLLSAMMGYLPATRGDIEVLGERYGESDWRELRRRIGIVSSALAPMLESEEPALRTVISGKFAMLGLWGTVEEADATRARTILADLECPYLEDRSWAVLSQGERQRVLIGRALMAAPPLLVLDEPCAGLDPAAREKFLQVLERFAKRPNAPTLVLVTHHVKEIVPTFSHILVLRQGNVLAAGPKSEVLSDSVLSAAFGCEASLERLGERYGLKLTLNLRSSGVGQEPNA